jgi:hypothetical protein
MTWYKDKIKERIKEKKSKRKDTWATRFEDNYGKRSLAMAPEMLVGISYLLQRSPQAHRNTVVALHPGVFRVSYFPRGTGV